MPYSMYRDGKKFCVKNSKTGESKGCSDTRKMAVAHMRALYAAEGGAKMGTKEIDELVEKAIEEFDQAEATTQVEENLEKSMDSPSYVYMATSYSELNQLKQEAEMINEINDAVYAFPSLAANILASPSIEDKASAIKSLGDELAGFISDSADNEEKARADVSPADKKRAVAEYGNVTYADPANKKYPIDTEKHIRAAWSYINMPKNAGKYSSAQVASIKRKIIAAWKRVIDKNGPPQAKELPIAQQVAEGVREAFMSLFNKEKAPEYDDGEAFLVWKEGGGTWRWVARYSNNFRDRDVVPEIISADAHKKFIEKVDKGLAEYPELWLWHVKEWKLGKADFLAWDDIGDGTGFAIAAGYGYPGRDAAFEWLSTKGNVGVSHGMPPSTVRYDENDPTIIVEYESVEVSPLPSWAAANHLTDFLSLKKEAEMAIPEEKRKALIEKWGMPEDVINMIESVNAQVAEKAVEEGLEHKEITEEKTETTEAAGTTETPEVTEEKTEEKKPEETPVEELTDEQKALEQPPSRKELADAITTVLMPVLKAQNEKIAALTATVEGLQKTKEDDVRETIASTPLASLGALLQESVIGRRETQVKEGDKLSGEKPKETPAVEGGTTPVPFINTLIMGKKQ